MEDSGRRGVKNAWTGFDEGVFAPGGDGRNETAFSLLGSERDMAMNEYGGVRG
jgi:hypothetical protein